MGTNRLATKGQLSRIVELYAKNKLPFDLAQELIKACSTQQLTETRLSKHLAFWEQHYPGKGEAIFNLLKPFYYWKPLLKPSTLYLNLYASEAIFWREINGIRVYSMHELSSLDSDLYDSVSSSLSDSICDTLMSLEDGELWSPLERRLEDNLLKDLKQTFKSAFGDSLDTAHHEFFWESLRSPIFYSVFSILIGAPDQSESFKYLFAMWLVGNYPIGFDETNRLLFLVA